MSAEGSVSVRVVRPALVELNARGVDPAPVLATAGVTVSLLDNVESRIPARIADMVWATAAIAVQDPAFGLRAAVHARRGTVGVVDYIHGTSRQVKDGVERMARFLPLLDERLSFTVLSKETGTWFELSVGCASPQYEEFLLGLFLARSREETQVNWKPEAVYLDHPAPADSSEHQRLLGCPVNFDAPKVAMKVAPEILELPHLQADASLMEILSRHADAQLADLPPHHGALRARVASTIARGFAGHLPTLESTASTLRMAPRTLQRQLAEEGTSHSELLDENRRGLALHYLSRAELSVGEIAFLLQFADSSAFHHAFKRWTGESPGEYRARQVGLPPRPRP